MGTSTGNKFGSCCHSQAIKFLYLPCANCLCKQNYFNDWINSVLFARARHAGCTARGPSPPVHCFILFHSRPIYARTSSFIWFHLVSSCFILFHFVSFRFISAPSAPVHWRFILFHLVSSRFISFHLVSSVSSGGKTGPSTLRKEGANLLAEKGEKGRKRGKKRGKRRAGLLPFN